MGQPPIFQNSTQNRFPENFGFKIIALFITLILWLHILGQRDFVINKFVNIEVLTDPNFVVVAQTSKDVELRLSGPRSKLKKLQEPNILKEISLNLTEVREGLIELEIPINKIELPPNVKLINLRPHKIRVEIMRKDHLKPDQLLQIEKSKNSNSNSKFEENKLEENKNGDDYE